MKTYTVHNGGQMMEFRERVNNDSIEGGGILPCPFCGATCDELCGVEHGHVPEKSKFFVQCVKCGVRMVQDRRDKVIGMWNQRVNKPT